MRTGRHDPVAERLQHLGVARGAATRLSRAGTLLEVAAGTVLCHEGERGTQAFLLVEGRADVRTRDATIEVGPGAIIGELATLDPHRTRNATVVAHSSLQVLVYDVVTYRSLADEDDLRDRLAPHRVAA